VLCAWGFITTFQGAAHEAIFADSTSNEKRAYYYSLRQFLMQMGFTLGPVVNVFLLVYIGNEWSLEVLDVLMVCGLGITGASAVLLFFFSDKHALAVSLIVSLSVVHKILSLLLFSNSN
jgi:MFS family permease